MYFPDLTPIRNDPRRLAVGWLEIGYDFPKGKLSEEILDRLFERCANPDFKTRGFHECPFCPKEIKMRQGVRKGKSAWLGSSQILAPGKGVTYDAPNLIYHYAADHDYRPPDEFIAALMQSTGALP